ncbi:MAG: septum formation protein Maf [Treponema sp.]|nr:septum formation protein Maf [Treponema sp.]
MYPIILASSSPRRQEILKLMNIPFVVNPANIEESYPSDMKCEKVAEYLAVKKVKAVMDSGSSEMESTWILGADTIIILDGKIYGQPKSQDEAYSFLQEFQGKVHKVMTGIALYNPESKKIVSKLCTSKVTFAQMSSEEIEWYLSTGEWHGAAGGYRIQGLASCFIKTISGTETAVMGLPMFDLYDILKSQNYSFIS